MNGFTDLSLIVYKLTDSVLSTISTDCPEVSLKNPLFCVFDDTFFSGGLVYTFMALRILARVVNRSVEILPI